MNIKALAVSACVLLSASRADAMGWWPFGSSSKPSINVTDVITKIEGGCNFIPVASTIEQLVAAALGHPEIVGGIVTVNSIATSVCNSLPPPVQALEGAAGQVEFSVGGVVIKGQRKQ